MLLLVSWSHCTIAGQLVSLYNCWSDQQDAGHLRGMHLPQKACDAHVTSFTRPSSRLTNSFFPASKIVIAEESEREGLGTRLYVYSGPPK